MLHRYCTSKKGKLHRKAKIFTNDEHKINIKDIDFHAVKIINHLNDYGFKAYIVGGAVRDLLLGRKPKDFDIATDAFPQKIRKLFRNSRIIGRRFKLVHIYFRKNKIIEVSTFRSEKSSPNVNHYGSLGEDAFRRDFSANALYYCPRNEHLIDYVDGFKDIQNKTLRILGNAKESFVEDPVRMLRAIKYASILGFNFQRSIEKNLKKCRYELHRCSKERLTEEFYKILKSGHSVDILKNAYDYKIFEVLLPSFKEYFGNSESEIAPLIQRLKELDNEVNSSPLIQRSDMLAIICMDFAKDNPEWKYGPLYPIQQFLRNILNPLVPSNKDLISTAHTIQRALRYKRKKQKKVAKQNYQRVLMRKSKVSTFSE